MQLTQTYIKIIVLMTILLASSWLSGCDPAYWDDEYGWSVYEEYEVIETTYHTPHIDHDRVTFEVSWPEYLLKQDLHIRLATPIHGIIKDDGIEIDGCFFLGTYNDLSRRTSIIECLDPYFGVFELMVRNPSTLAIPLHVKISKENLTEHHRYKDVYETDTTLLGDDQVDIAFGY